MLVMQGFPLSFAEFHIAVAAGILLSDLDYETFYKKRWYENATHRGYGPTPQKARPRSE